MKGIKLVDVDLSEALNRGGELYCEECGAVLIRTDEYNPKKEFQFDLYRTRKEQLNGTKI